MRASLWGLVFVAVVMLSSPGVDVPLSQTPTLALVLWSLALVASWFAAVRRTTPAHAQSRSLSPSAAK
jgi:hypothetical protein